MKAGISARERESGISHAANGHAPDPLSSGWIIETVINPFHCFYQDALHFHTQSKLALNRSESEASRLARGAFVFYLAAAESLVHHAATELGLPDLVRLVSNPERPIPTTETWRLVPVAMEGTCTAAFDFDAPPWPQFAELLTLRQSWSYPGPVSARRAYYRASRRDGDYEPLQPHQAPPSLGIKPDQLLFPRTGLPRDPYALRPKHLDTARGVLDAAISALDRRLAGALTRDQRHRREPVRVVHPPEGF